MSKFILILCLCTTVPVLAKTPLEEAMTDAEQVASGLHKLTEAEKTYLSDWLARREHGLQNHNDERVVTDAPEAATEISMRVVRQEDEFGLERQSDDVPAIKARLRGEFDGWDGETKFRLDNGQVWEQRVGGRYDAPTRMQPEVVIEKGRFGYYLKVIETGRMVGVRRVR